GTRARWLCGGGARGGAHLRAPGGVVLELHPEPRENRVMTLLNAKIGMLAVLVAAAQPWAQGGAYMPTTIAANQAALTAWQIQGEYWGMAQNGDTLGAWLVARGSNRYDV